MQVRNSCVGKKNPKGKLMANRIIKALSHPRDLLVYVITRYKLANSLSDEKYLKLIYRIMFGKKLNLEHPETFNEKLQWREVYYSDAGSL